MSHNSKDKPVVEEIGKYLEETAGITVFLDKWNLIPGEKWQEELEKALSQSRSFVFFVGQSTVIKQKHWLAQCYPNLIKSAKAL